MDMVDFMQTFIRMQASEPPPFQPYPRPWTAADRKRQEARRKALKRYTPGISKTYDAEATAASNRRYLEDRRG